MIDAGLFVPSRPPETEPVEACGFDDLIKDLVSGILKIEQRASSGAAACDHRIGDPLANLMTVLVRRNPLADIFQGRRHVGDGVLIELCQHFPRAPFDERSIEADKCLIPVPFLESGSEINVSCSIY
jgi:hypothetical protein